MDFGDSQYLGLPTKPNVFSTQNPMFATSLQLRADQARPDQLALPAKLAAVQRALPAKLAAVQLALPNKLAAVQLALPAKLAAVHLTKQRLPQATEYVVTGEKLRKSASLRKSVKAIKLSTNSGQSEKTASSSGSLYDRLRNRAIKSSPAGYFQEEEKEEEEEEEKEEYNFVDVDFLVRPHPEEELATRG